MHLFHYTKTETALKILRSESLLINKIYKSNDPLENKRVNFYNRDFDEENNRHFQNSLNKIKNELVRVLCFSKGDYVKFTELDVPILNDHNPRPGFFYPRAWAQYGDNHKGVCFIFNYNRLKKRVVEQFEGDFYIEHDKVRYTNILDIRKSPSYGLLMQIDLDDLRTLKERKYIINLLKTHAADLFFWKDIDWRDEKEYRWLLFNREFSKNNNDIYLQYDNSIVAVVLGIRFKKKSRREFVYYCTRKQIPLYHLREDDSLLVAHEVYDL